MTPNPPETDARREIAGLNRNFVDLLCAVPPGRSAFGLDESVLLRLRGLPLRSREAMARVPVLLAGFGDLPRTLPRGRVAEARPAPLAPGACSSCQVYAAGLLTWLWRVNRQEDSLLAVLHMGPGWALPDWLRQAGFGEIQQVADVAPGALEARFGSHPRAWPDLVRAVGAPNPDLLQASQMAFVQLALVGPGANPDSLAGRPVPPDPGDYNADG
jgi:hypothetical protein